MSGNIDYRAVIEYLKLSFDDNKISGIIMILSELEDKYIRLNKKIGEK